jgi:hypothetical protein
MDIMVEMSEPNLRRLVRALSALDYRPKVPVRLADFISEQNRRDWQQKKGMVVFAVTRGDSDPMELDIMVDSPLDFTSAYRRRTVLGAGDIRVPVVSIDDLIEMKRHASREQDLSDVEALKDVKALRPRKKVRR